MNILEEIKKLDFYHGLDPVKLNVQLQLYNLWVKGRPEANIRPVCSTIIGATGFGKTTVAFMAALENSLKGRATLILVPSSELKRQHTEALARWGIRHARVETIQKVIFDDRALHTDLLIIDEVHNAKAPKFSNVFKLVQRNYLMGLTATFPYDERAVVLTANCPVIAEISRQECIERNFVTDFRVHVIRIPMDARTRRKLIATNRSYEIARNFFLGDDNRPDPGAIFDILRELKNGDHTTIDEWVERRGSTRGSVIKHARMGRMKISERLEIMYTEPNKILFTQKLARHLGQTDKLIVFCKRNETVKQISDDLDAYMITGKTPKKKRGAIINEFAEKGKNILITADALNEGVDVRNIQYGIMNAFTSSTLDATQRIGRVIRNAEGKQKADIFILQCEAEGTVCPDEWWLKNIISDMKGKVTFYSQEQFERVWL